MTEPTVTRAAQKVGISQSAMSHAIGRLRRVLNDDVVRRTPRGLVPTPRALQFALRTRGLLRDLEHSFDEQLSFDPKTSERSFHIRMSAYSFGCLMPRLATRLREEAPRLTIRFDHLPVPGESDSDPGDIQIRACSVPVPGAGHLRMQLLADRLMLTMRRDHPAANQALPMDDFLALPHIGGAGAIAGTAMFDQALARKGLKRRIAVTTPSWPEVIPIILGSDLVAVLPQPWVAFYIEPERLALRPLPPAIAMPFIVEVVWNARDDRDAGHRWLRRLIETEFHRAHNEKFNRFRVTSIAA
jgi:DNA-binding transcriptional LysR family regulator